MINFVKSLSVKFPAVLAERKKKGEAVGMVAGQQRPGSPSRRLATTPETQQSLLKRLAFMAALIPLGKLVYLGLYDGLGANPIEKITRTTGYWTLTFLMITLTATPLKAFSGWNWPVRWRRMLGLFAFFYACLHFLTYLVLDQFFDWHAIVKDIAKRPYITVGFPAFLLLIPLAATSTNNMMKRLGGRRWKRLHRLIYLIAPAGVVHFWWLVKKDITEPLEFAAVAAVLLGFRLVKALGKDRILSATIKK